MNRTKKDEADYIENLKREDPIKTEVIVHFRASNRTLLQNQIRLLKAVIEAEESLLIYRKEILAVTEQRFNNPTECAAGCGIHYWDDKDGWHRTDEVK